MDDSIRFKCARPFVAVSDEDDILSVEGADWFREVLSRVEGLSVDPKLCQEDWGVVFFASRGEKKFWVGLSSWAEEDESEQGEWLVHLHHASFSWRQLFSRSGKEALRQLIAEVETVLRSDPEISEVTFDSPGAHA